MEKNTNAIISDIIQALEGEQLTLKAIDGKLCKFATARTKRQDAKRVFAANGGVTLTFAHARRAGNFMLDLLDVPGDGIMVLNSTLPGEATNTVLLILNAQSPKDRIEAESEVIAGCRLLGARYKGKGEFTTPCGRKFQIPLNKPVKAQQVRDAVICELAWQIDKKPQINLTSIQ